MWGTLRLAPIMPYFVVFLEFCPSNGREITEIAHLRGIRPLVMVINRNYPVCSSLGLFTDPTLEEGEGYDKLGPNLRFSFYGMRWQCRTKLGSDSIRSLWLHLHVITTGGQGNLESDWWAKLNTCSLYSKYSNAVFLLKFTRPFSSMEVGSQGETTPYGQLFLSPTFTGDSLVCFSYCCCCLSCAQVMWSLAANQASVRE